MKIDETASAAVGKLQDASRLQKLIAVAFEIRKNEVGACSAQILCRVVAGCDAHSPISCLASGSNIARRVANHENVIRIYRHSGKTTPVVSGTPNKLRTILGIGPKTSECEKGIQISARKFDSSTGLDITGSKPKGQVGAPLKILEKAVDSRKNSIVPGLMDLLGKEFHVCRKNLIVRIGVLKGPPRVEDFPDNCWICLSVEPNSVQSVDNANNLTEGTIECPNSCSTG